MSRAVERRAKHEAAFKFVHSRIRLHAETIALYAAEDVEAAEISRAFESVVSSCKQSIAWQSLFQGLQIAFQLVPSVVAVILAKSAIFSPGSGFVQATLTVQTATALYSVRQLLTSLILLLQLICCSSYRISYRTLTHRLRSSLPPSTMSVH
jgi:ABC-type uncharacterized transport system fused permease/ATPase subunit